MLPTLDWKIVGSALVYPTMKLSYILSFTALYQVLSRHLVVVDCRSSIRIFDVVQRCTVAGITRGHYCCRCFSRPCVVWDGWAIHGGVGACVSTVPGVRPMAAPRCLSFTGFNRPCHMATIVPLLSFANLSSRLGTVSSNAQTDWNSSSSPQTSYDSACLRQSMPASAESSCL